MGDENLIKIKLFFYCESKALGKNVFTEEYYTIARDEFGADMVTPEFQPWIEVSEREKEVAAAHTWLVLRSFSST